MSSPVAGIDPHQDQFTVGIVDLVGDEVHHESFDNNAVGYLAAIDVVRAHRVELVGVEASASWGSHVAVASPSASFDVREVPPQRSAAQRRSRQIDKTDVVDAVVTARALQGEPSLGPAQALEIYEQLVAEIEAVIEHRKALVETRVLMLRFVQASWPSFPPRSATSSPPPTRSKAASVASRPSTPPSSRPWLASIGCRGSRR